MQPDPLADVFQHHGRVLLVEHPGADQLAHGERALVERGVPRPLFGFQEFSDLAAQAAYPIPGAPDSPNGN